METNKPSTPERAPIDVFSHSRVVKDEFATPTFPIGAAHSTAENSMRWTLSMNKSAVKDEINSPPAKRFHRVRNPFEAALTDRLHLPTIASPSLFQRPTTPQMSSTQFEWTIEEVSSLKPADVEPHETQFEESPNPEVEAKAQSAISSFFKENKIVPSPVDCPLRNQRIILSELNGNTPICKPGRRIRDCGTQTALSLPSILPPDLELALRPYFQPHLAGTGYEFPCRPYGAKYFDADDALREELFGRNNIIVLGEQQSASECAKDMSLRRKLFDLPSTSPVNTIAEAVNMSQLSNRESSLLKRKQKRITIAGKLSDSPSDLSPIFGAKCFSPLTPGKSSPTKRNYRMNNFITEKLSPIMPPKHCESSRFQYRGDRSISGDRTFGNISALPISDQGSSPLLMMDAAETSMDNSFHAKIEHLKVKDTPLTGPVSASILLESTSAEPHSNIVGQDDTTEIFADDEDILMHVTSLDSSSQSNTPHVRRRWASRKNLSQSFGAIWPEENDEDEDMESVHMPSLSVTDMDKIIMSSEQTANIEGVELSQQGKPVDSSAPAAKQSSHGSSVFYRTDSGFNEMTTTSSFSPAVWPGADSTIVTSSDDFGPEKFLNEQRNMVCSSTPSKHHAARINDENEDSNAFKDLEN